MGAEQFLYEGMAGAGRGILSGAQHGAETRIKSAQSIADEDRRLAEMWSNFIGTTAGQVGELFTPGTPASREQAAIYEKMGKEYELKTGLEQAKIEMRDSLAKNDVERFMTQVGEIERMEEDQQNAWLETIVALSEAGVPREQWPAAPQAASGDAKLMMMMMGKYGR